MKKQLLLGVVILGLSLPVAVVGALAQPPEHAGPHHPPFSAQDMAAFTNARIAALKAGLELTPAQEKNWPAVESALRDIAKARAGRGPEAEKEAQEHPDVIERLHRVAKLLSTRSTELDKLADAAKPLYDSLDDAQKRRFGVLLHAVLKHHGHQMHMMMMHHEEGSDHGEEE